MQYRYGMFTQNQMVYAKEQMRKSIFFLLLCVDPSTKDEFTDIDIYKNFKNVLYKISGLNSLLNYPPEIVTVLSFLQRAYDELHNPEFDFTLYRKLILDAGATVLKIKEV